MQHYFSWTLKLRGKKYRSKTDLSDLPDIDDELQVAVVADAITGQIREALRQIYLSTAQTKKGDE